MRVLRGLRAQLWFAPHPDQFGLQEKLPRVTSGTGNPLVDPEGYRAYVDGAEKNLTDLLAKERDAKQPGADAHMAAEHRHGADASNDPFDHVTAKRGSFRRWADEIGKHEPESRFAVSEVVAVDLAHECFGPRHNHAGCPIRQAVRPRDSHHGR